MDSTACRSARGRWKGRSSTSASRPIGGTRLDHCFTDLERDDDGLARVTLTRSRDRDALSLWADESYPYLMLYTGDDRPDVSRRSLAVEPMTCPPHAFRSGEALIRLEPGARATSAWGIVASSRRVERLRRVAVADVDSLVLVLAASSLGAILSRLHRRLLLPTVVVEIVLGILIGPQVLGLADVDSYIDLLAQFGLVFLFFFAGLEVIEKRVPRRALVRGTTGWAISISIGLLLGMALERAGLDGEGWLLGVALATTTLGTLVPILGDAGLLRHRSARPFSGTASPASSGRSSSSRSS